MERSLLQIMPDHYTFHHHRVSKRSTTTSQVHHSMLQKDPEVCSLLFMVRVWLLSQQQQESECCDCHRVAVPVSGKSTCKLVSALLPLQMAVQPCFICLLKIQLAVSSCLATDNLAVNSLWSHFHQIEEIFESSVCIGFRIRKSDLASRDEMLSVCSFFR